MFFACTRTHGTNCPTLPGTVLAYTLCPAPLGTLSCWDAWTAGPQGCVKSCRRCACVAGRTREGLRAPCHPCVTDPGGTVVTNVPEEFGVISWFSPLVLPLVAPVRSLCRSGICCQFIPKSYSSEFCEKPSVKTQKWNFKLKILHNVTKIKRLFHSISVFFLPLICSPPACPGHLAHQFAPRGHLVLRIQGLPVFNSKKPWPGPRGCVYMCAIRSFVISLTSTSTRMLKMHNIYIMFNLALKKFSFLWVSLRTYLKYLFYYSFPDISYSLMGENWGKGLESQTLWS